MPADIGLLEAIYSQRAIRSFKPDPVPDDAVHKLIEAATKAPSGANRQPWKFLVIKDAATKQRIGDFYKQSFEAAYGGEVSPPPTIQPHVRASAEDLAENMGRVPLMILACLEHDGSPSAMGRGSSIYPAVQNLLLTARALGLGSVITTLHKRYEAEIKALLSIPENVETAALLPIGFPTDDVGYGPTRRAPVDEVTYWERWGGTGP